MQFRILGSMEVLDGTRRVDLPAGRGRALLALLVLHAGEAVSAERLIDELWGEHPPATAGTVLQGLVSRLRKELEPGRGKGEPPALLQTVGSGYRLAIEPDAVDADRFKQLLDATRGAALGVRSAMLAEALNLWQGPALADFTYEPFAQRAITALEELRLAAIEDRIGVAAQALSRAAMARSRSDAGDHREAERLAREAVGLAPGEMLNLRAEVLVELAEVLRAGNQEQSTKEAMREAARLYELKGNIVSAEQMPRLD